LQIFDSSHCPPCTTEVWTPRGLVTYYTLFVLELPSRRVHMVGSTPYRMKPSLFKPCAVMANAIDGVLADGCVLICDRDRKWSRGVREFLEREGVRIIRTPFRAPNCNAYAERFVRSIKEECLECVILLGERHLRRTIAEFVAHYHAERNHQGIGNE
jgi:putative transposase